MKGICCYCKKPIGKDEQYQYFHSDCYDKYEEWKNEQDDMICPHCGYEFDDCEKEYEEGEKDMNCPSCGKIFTVEASCDWNWKTYRREEDFVDEEDDSEV